MTSWIKEAVFYHIYPLGFVGAAQYHEEDITHSIKKVEDWIPHMKKLGVNALYLGPVLKAMSMAMTQAITACWIIA